MSATSSAVAALGGCYETVRESIERGAYAMPGELVDVGGHRLHVHCTGSGSPTVVLEPGLGGASSAMSEWIAPRVARTTKVCVYDRAGRGFSEAASGAQDGVEVATDLHTLLGRARMKGPYVLAGHSLGGIYGLSFAHRYPDQVAGMVLLDSTHPRRSASQSAGAGAFAVLPSVSRLGIARLVVDPRDGSPPAQARSLRDELAEIPTALAQAGEVETLGDRPLAVVTALRERKPGGRRSRTTWPRCRPTAFTACCRERRTSRCSTTRAMQRRPATQSALSLSRCGPQDRLGGRSVFSRALSSRVTRAIAVARVLRRLAQLRQPGRAASALKRICSTRRRVSRGRPRAPDRRGARPAHGSQQVCFKAALHRAAFEREPTVLRIFAMAVALQLQLQLLPVLALLGVSLAPVGLFPVAQILGGLVFGPGMALAGGCLTRILWKTGARSTAIAISRSARS